MRRIESIYMKEVIKDFFGWIVLTGIIGLLVWMFAVAI